MIESIIIEIIIEVVFILCTVLWSAFVTYLNLCCKDEIWKTIYERMGWNETSIK